MPPLTTIYALIDPINSKVFYVGATERPLKDRLRSHISATKDTMKGNIRKNLYISKLLAAGVKPLIQEIEVCVGYTQPRYAERFWVYHYLISNHPLVNISILDYYQVRMKKLPKNRCLHTLQS